MPAPEHVFRYRPNIWLDSFRKSQGESISSISCDRFTNVPTKLHKAIYVYEPLALIHLRP